MQIVHAKAVYESFMQGNQKERKCIALGMLSRGEGFEEHQANNTNILKCDFHGLG